MERRELPDAYYRVLASLIVRIRLEEIRRGAECESLSVPAAGEVQTLASTR